MIGKACVALFNPSNNQITYGDLVSVPQTPDDYAYPCVMSQTSIFVGCSSSGSKPCGYAYGMSISNLTISVGTKTLVQGSWVNYGGVKVIKINQNQVLHCLGTTSTYITITLCSINGTTVSGGSSITPDQYYPYDFNVIQLSNDKFLWVATWWSNTGSDYQLRAFILTISGNSISSSTKINLGSIPR